MLTVSLRSSTVRRPVPCALLKPCQRSVGSTLAITSAYTVRAITSERTARTKYDGVPTVTCAAIGPGPRDMIDILTKHLKIVVM